MRRKELVLPYLRRKVLWNLVIVLWVLLVLLSTILPKLLLETWGTSYLLWSWWVRKIDLASKKSWDGSLTLDYMFD